MFTIYLKEGYMLIDGKSKNLLARLFCQNVIFRVFVFLT